MRLPRKAWGKAKMKRAGLALLLLTALTTFLVFFKFWSAQSDLDLNNDKVDRIVFEQAQSEALDEAAEWRRMYDEQAVKCMKYAEKIAEVNRILAKKNQEFENLKSRLKDLEKENHELQLEVPKLKQEVEDYKLECGNLQTKGN